MEFLDSLPEDFQISPKLKGTSETFEFLGIIAKKLNLQFHSKKDSKTYDFFETSNKKTSLYCLFAKGEKKDFYIQYYFTIRQYQFDLLNAYPNKIIAFTCENKGSILLFDCDKLLPLINSFRRVDKENDNKKRWDFYFIKQGNKYLIKKTEKEVTSFLI